ncbi:MAG: hypothetical protein AAF806_10930 [Bacteroidota bacterium]
MDTRRIGLFFILFLLSSSVAFTQFRRVLHKTFELKKAPEINLDLTGDQVVIENWSGDVILTETTVRIETGSNSMLNHFTEQGRYEILSTDPDSTVIMVVTSKVKDREDIKIRRWTDDDMNEVSISESVHIKVFIPEEYEHVDEGRTRWKLKPPTEEEEKEKEEDTTPKGGIPQQKRG